MTIVPRIRFITVAAGVALAGSLAPAQAAPASATATASRTGANVQGQNHSADPGRRLCFRAEMPNSRIKPRLCRTEAEWDRSGWVLTKD